VKNQSEGLISERRARIEFGSSEIDAERMRGMTGACCCCGCGCGAALLSSVEAFSGADWERTTATGSVPLLPPLVLPATAVESTREDAKEEETETEEF